MEAECVYEVKVTERFSGKLSARVVSTLERECPNRTGLEI